MRYTPVKVNEPLPSFKCEVWWRADVRTYANYDPFAEFEQPSGSHDIIELTPFEVLYHTPKGVKVRRWMGAEEQVLGVATRQLCVPTKELALRDLLARKKIHAEMAQKRADRAAEQRDAVARAIG